MDTSISGFTAGPSNGGRQLHAGPRSRNQGESNLLQVSLMRGVDFGTHFQSLPTNPAFFQDMLAEELTGELGKKKMKGKTERGGGQPQDWREILYACALKH